MRKFVRYAVLGIGSVLACADAIAGSSNPEEVARANTKLFIESTTLGRATCESLARKPVPATQLEKCISDLKDDADRRFKLLPTALGPQSDAMKYAREFYTYWLTSVGELAPKDGEAQDSYASRQSASIAQLPELQKKLEAAVP
jgi:hypothetical protein